MAESSSDASEFSAEVSIGPSLAMRSGDKTYVSIFCHPSNSSNQLLLIRVPIQSLLSPNIKIMSNSLDNNPYDLQKHYTHEACLHPSELTKDFTHFWSMCGTCTSSVSGLGPCIFLFNSPSKVFRYNLLHHQPNTMRKFHKCANMAAAIKDDNALCVQIGDFLYVLTYAAGNQLVLQKYDIQKDNWTLVKDNITTRCKYTNQYNLHNLPHVVINGKLHISFRYEYDSFAFDTETDTWEYSNLFYTFNLPGKKHLWNLIDMTSSKFSRRSFGFFGRGIVWDKDILLAVPFFSSECQLIAYQLIDNKVVKIQPFTFTDTVFESVQLVDLGQGYFGLLHSTTSCVTHYDMLHNLEMVTILVSKPPQPRGDCFLECRIVRKDLVAQNLNYNVMIAYKAFSV